jgi:hypothetical protein
MLRVRFPMRSLDFSVDLILPAPTVALWSTQPLAEMSTRKLHGCKGQPVRNDGNLTAICEPRRLTTLWASTACCRDRFYFFMQEKGCQHFFLTEGTSFSVVNHNLQHRKVQYQGVCSLQVLWPVRSSLPRLRYAPPHISSLLTWYPPNWLT